MTKTLRKQITKNEAPLDVWVMEALNEFLRQGILRTPTAQECRDAYDLGESPQTWADHIAGFAQVSA